MTAPVSGPGGVSSAWAMTGASAPMPPAKRMSDLFDRIDNQNSGSITKPQLQTAFQTLTPPVNFKAYGVDKTWNTLDPNNEGSVSKDSFISNMTGLMTSLRGYAASQGGK
jgi:Ca2+-binding EF-hand superfamily protein